MLNKPVRNYQPHHEHLRFDFRRQRPFVTSATSNLHMDGYLMKGPLLKLCGAPGPRFEEWLIAGKQLAFQLGYEHDNMDDVQKERVYHYYIPIFFWCLDQIAAHRDTGVNKAMILGISAPQGCGKTTLVEQLELLLAWKGLRAASVSIDDFYLTYKDQTALALENNENKLLQYRGNAGSHDLSLGTNTLIALRDLRSEGSTMKVPRYEKSAYAGRGDRADISTWPSVTGPLDVILYEGWMTGFTPLADDSQALAVNPDLVKVNRLLRSYPSTLDSLVDSWLVIKVGDKQWVCKWRLQAEERMKASGKAGMTEDQVADFVSRYMPAYEAYLPTLYKKGPSTGKKGRTLIIEVDQSRSPTNKQPSRVL
ncbi:hypothetical protein CEUSTIGMA_g1363.t1 [Chlamydomonas eustigma]|uniref:Phosphoribulokinase/uridine kinase domain-containing protein n=1 Tax=Chlamydomonas eustigma TaxID=1157962 RepID=A0A250WSW7_9CHLO|nr:hypothetical protein CEUSTIGMA_g1363.t1 [Chlamydomonas eustigma]|eukprot:GAX73913.1 hypothetical protein CEUSTIGMA_g1363.t1 [Chlamydomonas eustigma]